MRLLSSLLSVLCLTIRYFPFRGFLMQSISSWGYSSAGSPKLPVTHPCLFKKENPVWNKLPEMGIHGGIAQLGERLNGIQEVSGSIPPISTRMFRKERLRPVFARKQAFCFIILKKRWGQPCPRPRTSSSPRCQAGLNF